MGNPQITKVSEAVEKLKAANFYEVLQPFLLHRFI